ncbi:RNA polymerase II subunit A C-terminal domain phosphatase [Corythoichthys intestinalis]|uniref:RNA polymerase II subunit A C-terminal domain phosphatase n=1 Tax=Corythoichthys intestinalis TaxID=161448 RepID=UPI0025A575DB|nr:RNA polymerase II subunit A C-terminal domain phosphatase [Corythoichthys intestinalis]
MEDPPADSGGGDASTLGPALQVSDICCTIGTFPCRLVEWKVKPGSYVNVDSVLALCVPIPPEKVEGTPRLHERKVKSDRAGVVQELCCQPGQVIPPGGVIVRIAGCSHPIVMKGLCAECGQDLTQLQSTNGNQQTPISTATVSMVHSVPELMVSSEQAEQLGREDQQRLHRNKKLVLMVDLDQTLIHTTDQHCQKMSNKGIFHFQLGRGEPMLHTRLRPHCKEFLEKIAKLYELHVFTFGSRLYAHTIAGFLDPETKLFSHRILSRDECIDPFSKTGNLRYLFPCGDSMVCIIDDREDVWKFAPNLITVKKYIYFEGIGDMNAPPGSQEALMAKKGNPPGRPAENTEASENLCADEQNNGLRKKPVKDGSAASHCSQGIPANERTHPAASVQGEVLTEKHSEPDEEAAVKKTQGVDSQENSKESISRTEEALDSLNSLKPNNESNNLDFDLSSDSDSESVRDKTPLVDGGNQTKKSEHEVASLEDSDEAKESSGKVQSSDSAETSDILLPELGNGCSDRREPETESQNSEQSGVTMGEELLDQSMEDEEEEEVDNDKDDHLIYLEEVLERIHGEYYARYEAFLKTEVPDTPDIRKIVPELKSKTLDGTTLVFSGLYPTNYPIERTREYYHAKALGAKIGKNLVLSSQESNGTTHLIAAKSGTEKVRQAQECKNLHVVNPDWLWSCLERWERVEEKLFPLKEDYTKQPWSNSPAAFIDKQGSRQKPVLQNPPPIQHRPPPALPEVRTYDPVTGKLIRKVPQASLQVPFLQASDQQEQSCLRGVPNCQQDVAAGTSQDDESLGPARRKRQPSMSETMPLYTLCKEDLESMDKEVDDILGEESDNESEGRGKEKAGNEEAEEEEEQQQQDEQHHRKGEGPLTGGGLGPQALKTHDPVQTICDEANLLSTVSRGHKRKHEDGKEDDDDVGKDDESSKDDEEEEDEEEGSSSEADEMAAALEAELNDFM